MIGRSAISKPAVCCRCFCANWFIRPAMNCVRLTSPGTTTQSVKVGMAWFRPPQPPRGSPKGNPGGSSAPIKRPGSKAESDYIARLRTVSPSERAERTFVFVTPRNWPGKVEWAKNKQTAGDWKAVRAFDASDLEQWVEESISGQMWLAEQLAIPVDGFETLDQCWRRWAEASEPKMSPSIFEPSTIAYREKFKRWLENPNKDPFVVTADSKDEALAFLACLFENSDIPPRSRDLAVVFESSQPLRNPGSFIVPHSFQSSTLTKPNVNWLLSIANIVPSSFGLAMQLI